MTKQQKARAHLARAQELLREIDLADLADLAFGGIKSKRETVFDKSYGAKHNLFDEHVKPRKSRKVGINAEKLSQDDEQALLHAIDGHNLSQVAKMLTNSNVDSIITTNGSTPLMIAASSSTSLGSTQVLQVILDKGADCNVTRPDGMTALIFACEFKNWDVARILIKAGADVNARKSNGYTALTTASAHGEASIVRSLLYAGADIDALNNDGDTALTRASEEKRPSVVKILLEMGANTKIKTKMVHEPYLPVGFEGYTALQIAILDAKTGDFSVARVFGINNKQDLDVAVCIGGLYRDWKKSKLIRKSLHKPVTVDVFKACDSVYFGRQHGSICYAVSAIGLMVKFLASDKKLFNTHPHLYELQRKMHAEHPLLAADLHKTKQKSRFKDVWKVQDDLRKMLTVGAYEEMKLENLLGTLHGGFEHFLLSAFVLTAGYRVGFVEMKNGSILVGHHVHLKNGKLEETGTCKISDFSKQKSQYFVVRVVVKPDELPLHRPYVYFNSLFQDDLALFHEQGILHRLCGGFFAINSKSQSNHAVMFSICHGKLVVFDARSEHRCIGLDNPASFWTKSTSNQAYTHDIADVSGIDVEYVFAPEEVRLSTQFTKDEFSSMNHFSPMQQNEYLTAKGVDAHGLELPFFAWKHNEPVAVYRKASDSEFRALTGDYGSMIKVQAAELSPMSYSERIFGHRQIHISSTTTNKQTGASHTRWTAEKQVYADTSFADF